MTRPARFVVGVVILIGGAASANGQANARTTPQPDVTAENAPWYLRGDPVVYVGDFYFPAGPEVYFNRYEMVRSGFFQGVPLYARTTIEPYSVVFVPVGHGLMQPYERRRAGDLAGTAGSTAPSFPVDVRAEQDAPWTLQAAAPPMRANPHITEGLVGMRPSKRACRPQKLARRAHSRAGNQRQSPSPSTDGVMRTAERPEGLNAVFVQFDRQRYFSTGRPVLLGRQTFDRVGEYNGLPVYTHGADPRTIYIPLLPDGDFLAPYSQRIPQRR